MAETRDYSQIDENGKVLVDGLTTADAAGILGLEGNEAKFYEIQARTGMHLEEKGNVLTQGDVVPLTQNAAHLLMQKRIDSLNAEIAGDENIDSAAKAQMLNQMSNLDTKYVDINAFMNSSLVSPASPVIQNSSPIIQPAPQKHVPAFLQEAMNAGKGMQTAGVTTLHDVGLGGLTDKNGEEFSDKDVMAALTELDQFKTKGDGGKGILS